jgi:membrane-associated protease RseP (regulator of RpoE activity)
MLGQVSPTPFDLRFSLLGIPVRVHPFFWLVSAIMGWNPHEPNYMFLWVACVFVSILVHEFGHALTARYFGWPPEVVLYSFGGFAAFTPTWGYTTGRAVLVLLAGPGAGFVLYALLLGAERLILNDLPFAGDGRLRYLNYALSRMELINLGWGLLNLLPVFPLDGGQIARHLFTHARSRNGLENSLKLSLLVAGGMSAWFFTHGATWPGVLFAALAFENLQALQGPRYF